VTDTPPGETSTPLEVAAPAWLSEGGRQYWADLARHLPPGQLRPADVHAFAMLCNELATYADADAIVQESGLLLESGVAGLVVNPALTIRNTAAAAMARWATYLRLTPGDQVDRRNPPGLRHRREH
jgi:P27 family predicted phage terminase small subunit